MKFYDVWGTEQTYNHMSAGWSWAFDTPFDWFKQNASRLGGINQNMVVSWPARIKDKGGLREQFVHVIDVVPTILEAAGIRAPEIVDGIKQEPIEGTSFAYTFDAKQRQGAVAAQDAVLRDDGPVGALPRRLVPEHQGQSRALGGLRPGQPGSAEQPGAPALQPEQGLQPDRGHRGEEPAEGQGDEAEVHRRGEEVPGLPAGRVGGGAHRRAAPEHHRRAHRVRLHAADDRTAAGRFAAAAEHLLHDHRRHRGAAGRRRGHDPDLGRALRAATASTC